ncbi:MAG: hypothetical protein AAF125_01265 [Chloroflexota bacterium]
MMETIRVADRIGALQTNLDAVERFLALYDLYKFMSKGRPSVADASQINEAMQAAASNDRDLNVRAWASYFQDRIWGKRGLRPKPYLPKMWQLLIVEEIL